MWHELYTCTYTHVYTHTATQNQQIPIPMSQICLSKLMGFTLFHFVFHVSINTVMTTQIQMCFLWATSSKFYDGLIQMGFYT